MAATSDEAKERTEVRMLHLTFESLLLVQIMVASHLSAAQGVNPIVSVSLLKADAPWERGEGRALEYSREGEVGLPAWRAPSGF